MEKHKDYLLELLKDRYEHESARYKEFEASLGIPITVLTALCAALYFVGTDKELVNSIGVGHVLVLVFFGFLLINIVITIGYLIGVYFGFKRAWIAFPESKTIKENDIQSLSQYVQEVEPDNFEFRMIQELKDNAIEWYVSCNTDNTRTNNVRGDRMYYARLFLILSLISGLLLLGTSLYIKNINMSKQETKPREQTQRPKASPVTQQRNDTPTNPKPIIEKR
jgi:hypothetical protein